jgi:hypothetical protein
LDTDHPSWGVFFHAETQPIWVPCLPQLRRPLDATPRTAVQMMISENTERPYREGDFQHTFAELRDAAGLTEDLQFRDLRRTLANRTWCGGVHRRSDPLGHRTQDEGGCWGVCAARSDVCRERDPQATTRHAGTKAEAKLNGLPDSFNSIGENVQRFQCLPG